MTELQLIALRLVHTRNFVTASLQRELDRLTAEELLIVEALRQKYAEESRPLRLYSDVELEAIRK